MKTSPLTPKYKSRNAVIVTDLGPAHSTVRVWLGGNRHKWVFRSDLTPGNHNSK